MRVRGRLADGERVVDVMVRGDQILAIEPPSGAAALGGPDVVVAPAMIDLQVNGYGGYDFNSGVWNDQPASVEAAGKVVDRLREFGVARFCPTLVTNSEERFIEGLRCIVEARRQDPGVARALPGIHVEGPFLATEDGPRGAHDQAYVIDPDWDFFQRLQEAAEGLIRILTIAPERPGAIPVIQKAVASGVIVSIGHSGATPEDVRRAVDAGASLCTHLGNGSHAVLPRHPNYIWEQLAADELTACFIADLEHLPASVLKTFVRAKGPGRFCAVSDCVALGGLPPGLYDGGRHEVLPSGRVNLAGTPYLAGAGHRLDSGLANLHRHAGLDEAAALAAVTLGPAKVLGLDHEVGTLAPGQAADLMCFRWTAAGPIEVRATMVAGEVVYRAA